MRFFQFLPNGPAHRFLQPVFLLALQQGADDERLAVSVRGGLQKLPRAAVIFAAQIGAEYELRPRRPVHPSLTRPESCANARSNPTAFTLSSGRNIARHRPSLGPTWRCTIPAPPPSMTVGRARRSNPASVTNANSRSV